MEFAVVVLHRKALAHYTVIVTGGFYEARLLKYAGSSHDLPPPRIRFEKEGRHCSGDTDEQDLMDDLYHTVRIEMEKESGELSSDANIEVPKVSI